ncbi:MAG TPA: sterol desaturase family protein [Geobacteraceae bacterium]|nr:sterol desaturase family protein [Geobacteraceae bacterium]
MHEEQIIRLSFFFGVLACIGVWEVIAPRRTLTDNKGRRWFTNLSLVVIDTVVVRFALPVVPVGMAYLARERGWGMLNSIALPDWSEIVLAVVALDFVIYLQHVLFHYLPVFWRFHRMHHTDLDIDVTTGNRFHPIEIVISIGIKLMAVVLIGPPAMAVVIFEVLLNATSQFNHGNIRMPEAADRFLRLLVVTPDMHRVHHSVIPRETNSNFGFNLPWWDRLCGTYRPQPELGHTGMTIGLKEFRDPALLSLPRLLKLPFIP